MQSARYLLIEYWSEMLVYEQHRASRSAVLEAIETRRAELVDVMEPLGIYSALDVTGPVGTDLVAAALSAHPSA